MLPLVELTAEEVERIVATVEGGAANVADVYPLAPLQEGLLFHHLLADGGEDAYVLPTVLEFDSRARLDAFLGALQQVVDRHDIFRRPRGVGGLREPVQVVWRRAVLPVDGGGRWIRRGPIRCASWLRWAACRWTWAGPRCSAARGGRAGHGRWLVLLRMHHMVQDHTALEVVLERGAGVPRRAWRGAAAAAAVPRLRGAGTSRGRRPEHERRTSPSCSGDVTSRRRRSAWWTCAVTAQR